MYCRVIRTKSSEVRKLTPRIIDQASLVSRTPSLPQQRAEFEVMTHQWAGHVRELMDATHQASLPWSHRTQLLIDAAQRGEGLEAQVIMELSFGEQCSLLYYALYNSTILKHGCR